MIGSPTPGTKRNICPTSDRFRLCGIETPCDETAAFRNDFRDFRAPESKRRGGKTEKGTEKNH